MFLFKNIHQYHQELIQNNTSCTQTVTYYLKQIERSKHLNAFINIYTDEALAIAKQLDKKRKWYTCP